MNENMDSYVIVITLIGFAALTMAWMPSITQKTRISYSIFYVLLGVLVYSFIKDLPDPLPYKNLSYTLHLSELMVLISLMGTGLKIDQPFSFRSWSIPFRLIVITMILTIAVVSGLGLFFLNLSVAASLLLGAALAPTDPVLASDVQVGPPLEQRNDNSRFVLTAEGGLNDGMAFPFVWLAIAVGIAGQKGESADMMNWFLYDIVYRILAGVVAGFLFGKFLAWIVFSLPEKKRFIKTRDGFVAISATLLVYGISELIHGYGFIAVFVTAVTIRNYELMHKYHRKLHSFTDQIERILLAVVLMLFGGALVRGVIADLSLTMALFGFAFVFLIRPLCCYVALVKTSLYFKEKLAISFFGIRGIGSFFYLAFAFNVAHFGFSEVLWGLVSFIVLLSIIVHGCTAVFAMQKIEEELPEAGNAEIKQARN